MHLSASLLLAAALPFAAAQSQHSPAVAGTLSFVVPGLSIGQWYNGETAHAALYTGAVATAIAIYVYDAQQVTTFNGQPTGIASCTANSGCGTGPRSPTVAGIAAIAAVGFWVGSIYDAAEGARRYNAKRAAPRVGVSPALTRDARDRPMYGLCVAIR